MRKSSSLLMGAASHIAAGAIAKAVRPALTTSFIELCEVENFHT